MTLLQLVEQSVSNHQTGSERISFLFVVPVSLISSFRETPRNNPMSPVVGEWGGRNACKKTQEHEAKTGMGCHALISHPYCNPPKLGRRSRNTNARDQPWLTDLYV